jgi:flagellar biosynthesis protein FliR
VKNTLLWIGLAALAMGSVMAIILKRAADTAAFETQLIGAQMGYVWDDAPNYTGMWVSIIVAALGAIAILMHLYGASRRLDL